MTPTVRLASHGRRDRQDDCDLRAPLDRAVSIEGKGYFDADEDLIPPMTHPVQMPAGTTQPTPTRRTLSTRMKFEICACGRRWFDHDGPCSCGTSIPRSRSITLITAGGTGTITLGGKILSCRAGDQRSDLARDEITGAAVFPGAPGTHDLHLLLDSARVFAVRGLPTSGHAHGLAERITNWLEDDGTYGPPLIDIAHWYYSALPDISCAACLATHMRRYDTHAAVRRAMLLGQLRECEDRALCGALTIGVGRDEVAARA